MQPELNLPAPPSTGLDCPSHSPPAQRQVLPRPAEIFQPHLHADHTASSLVLYHSPTHVASSVAPFTTGDGTCRSLAPTCDSSGSATNLVGAEPTLVSSVSSSTCNLLVQMEFQDVLSVLIQYFGQPSCNGFVFSQCVVKKLRMRHMGLMCSLNSSWSHIYM
jgi:hypothetical protein